MTLVTVATCNLNQWALDFDGNVERIYESCIEARKQNATYRLGPELEICGYGCEDHFYEYDTILHCWESLILLLQRGTTDNGMICDFGMPVVFHGVRYNCRIICQNRKILLIRPKVSLADNGNYRESRYFTAYNHASNDNYNNNNNSNKGNILDQYVLPIEFQEKFDQIVAPFGTNYLLFKDGISIGCESCEELWTPAATHVNLALQGVDIIGNGSGSHHELRKLNTRLELIVNATRICGGIYLYSNQRGCDGGRLYYDGGALIVCNGIILAQATQFSLNDVDVISATIDIDDVRSYRASIPSFGIQATKSYNTNRSDCILCPNETFTAGSSHIPTSSVVSHSTTISVQPTPTVEKLQFHCPEEECCIGPACWLWDYLRRSGSAGFFLPLSGGADSSSVAAIVYIMCTMVTTASIDNPTGLVATDLRRICHKPKDWVPTSPQEVSNCILHTTYMGTTNSSINTKSRAERLSAAIGSYHLSITIDGIVQAVLYMFTTVTGKVPKYTSHGGTKVEDLALQNIQARIRMVTAYLLAQLLPWVRNTTNTSPGFLLVLGSANVDEGLRGYMTKYDCSSADLNPIGAISKGDLKKMLLWISTQHSEVYDVLQEIANAPPTAELRPMNHNSTSNDKNNNNSNNDNDNNNNASADGTDTSSSCEEAKHNNNSTAEHTQLDEEEMGMTYAELGFYGKLRKISRCGPVSMFRKLCLVWNMLQPSEVAEKVKRFFYYYSINRHKMCTITPSYHAEGYSPDDNRFDLRQFLYNVQWTRQFRVIDTLVNSYKYQNEQNQQLHQPQIEENK